MNNTILKECLGQKYWHLCNSLFFELLLSVQIVKSILLSVVPWLRLLKIVKPHLGLEGRNVISRTFVPSSEDSQPSTF